MLQVLEWIFFWLFAPFVVILLFVAALWYKIIKSKESKAKLHNEFAQYRHIVMNKNGVGYRAMDDTQYKQYLKEQNESQ